MHILLINADKGMVFVSQLQVSNGDNGLLSFPKLARYGSETSPFFVPSILSKTSINKIIILCRGCSVWAHTETLVPIPKPKFSGIPISILIPNQIFGNPEIVSGFRDKSGIPK